MTDNGKIPFLDLVALHEELKVELISLFRSVLESAGFVGGPLVEMFERDFAQLCECHKCVGVASGTDALRFALLAAGIGLGDTVITVPNTFIATAEAISQVGARPDFVDIEDRTYLMDSRKLEEYLKSRCFLDSAAGRLFNRKTRTPVTAVIPVHLYGQMADMDPILELAERYRLVVIEDACQAHGAAYYSRKQGRWMRAGSMGAAGAFSFYPGKNLGACGEAGAVTTNHDGIAAKVRMVRDHGQSRKYHHEMEGYNGRLDALQAGILRAKLKHLERWNQARRDKADQYTQAFRSQSASISAPETRAGTIPAFHLYVIRVKNRDVIQARLAEVGISTQIHYPIPLHLQPAYQSLGYAEGDFPVAEKAAQEILSLPLYPQLSHRKQNRVIATILELMEEQEPTRHSRAAIDPAGLECPGT